MILRYPFSLIVNDISRDIYIHTYIYTYICLQYMDVFAYNNYRFTNWPLSAFITSKYFNILEIN